MDLFKVRRLRKWRRKEVEDDRDDDPKRETGDDGEGKGRSSKDAVAIGEEYEEDDDDDDFITNEVKRRLKELRKNSFMVLIPEEECLEDEEAEESGSSEGGDACGCWCGFDVFYDSYCQRMLFFDKVSERLLEEGPRYNSGKSPTSITKRVALSFRNLSFKKRDGLNDDIEHLELQVEQPMESPYENFETVYMAQVCLSWEVLHFQYMQLSQKLLSQYENPSCCYSYACQAFQQFQVLLQRFIENEPFQDGSRVEAYVRARKSLPLLLQVPRYEDLEMKGNQEDSYRSPIPVTDLLKIMEDSILTFHQFLKIEKNSRPLHLFGDHNQAGRMLQLLQNSLSKKEAKLKELYKKKRSRQKEGNLRMGEEIDLLFALIDIKVISRVLKMDKISKQQLLWCEEKMCKLEISENRLHRHGSPVIFPC